MEGRPFVRKGKTLLSGIDPIRRCERTANAVLLKNKTLYFCPSPLYGYGLSRFLTRLETEAPNSAILCIEADSELFELSQKNIDSSVTANKRFQLTNICDIKKLYLLVRQVWGVRAFRRVETLHLSGGWQLFEQLYDSLRETLQSEITTDWSNTLTLAKLGRLYIRNFFRNLTLIPQFRSISNLTFGSSPVLVLGAGPSLDVTLDALQKQDVKCRPFKIICVDTCLGALKNRGIEPDLTVILESQHWNLRDFIGCHGWKIPAAIDLSSLPASAKKLTGESFLFMTPWTSLALFERLKDAQLLPAIFPPLGSVGLAAVELARRLTSGKIICTGLDFSFTHDMNHARCTPGHRSKLNTQTRFKRILNSAAFDVYSFSVFSKSGLAVLSNPVMNNYRNLFEQEFGGDSRIFDIEGTGLPLGVKTLSIDEAISMLNDKNFNHEPSRTITNNEKISDDKFVGVRKVCGRTSDLITFYKGEINRLEELRGILTGEAAMDQERLKCLVDECDYLWGHFPDYAGGRDADLTDISFLKRIRAEIDPMLKLITRMAALNQ